MEKIEEILFNEIKFLISGIRGEPQTLSILPELILSIIHKINNKMTPLIGYTQLLMKNSEGIEQEKLKKIYNSGTLVSSILGSLFEYLKTFPYPKRMCRIGEFVREVLENDERLKNIDLKLFVEEDINVPINKTQMREAIKKIIDNSLEAMKKPEKRIEVKISRSENNVIIEFWDNGEGIEKEKISSIFEPFFTTREGSRGLGLSYVHGIVKNHGGDIKAESEKENWTKIIISIPLVPFDWKEEKVLLLAPENDFYKILCKIAELESINLEWMKEEVDLGKYTHIILDEDFKNEEEIIRIIKEFKGKIIYIGNKERESVILVRKPATIFKILLSLCY